MFDIVSLFDSGLWQKLSKILDNLLFEGYHIDINLIGGM